MGHNSIYVYIYNTIYVRSNLCVLVVYSCQIYLYVYIYIYELSDILWYTNYGCSNSYQYLYCRNMYIYIYIDSYGPLTRQNKPAVIDMFTQSGDKLMIVVLFSGYL